MCKFLAFLGQSFNGRIDCFSGIPFPLYDDRLAINKTRTPLFYSLCKAKDGSVQRNSVKPVVFDPSCR